MTKKNILIFYGEKRSSGGIETYVNLLNKTLSKDYNLHNIFFTEDEKLASSPKKDSYPILIKKDKTINDEDTVKRFHDCFIDLDEKYEFDLIHINSTNILAGYILAKEAKQLEIPLVSTNHYWKNRNTANLDLREETSKKTFELSDKIICVSHASAQALDYIAQDKKVVIHPSVDFNFFKPIKNLKQKDSTFKIIYPAAYSTVKNQLELLELAIQFKKECKDFSINFYGSFNSIENQGYMQNLKDNVLNRKLKKYVSVNNDVDIEYMPKLLSMNHLLISTSLYESFGQIFTEAQSCELPVIGYNLGGIPETMQDKKTGFLVDVNDIDGLVKKAKQFYDSKQLREEFGKRGRDFVKQNFSASETAKKYCYEYQKLLD